MNRLYRVIAKLQLLWGIIRNQVTPDMLLAGSRLASFLAGSGQTVTEESAKRLATAYRCGNVLSDDVARIPLQLYTRRGDRVQRVQPSAILRDVAYQIEIRPNRYMIPFIFWKAVIQWLIYWGNAYIWSPPGSREKFILPANSTGPVFDQDGNLWYEVTFASGQREYLPSVEVMHLMINSLDGIVGRSVLAYARDTLGRQQSAYGTQDMLFKQGLTPAAVIWMNGDLNEEARDKVRDSYTRSITGVTGAGRAAVFDSKVVKYESVPMKASDAQFLESIQATDVEIANFFGVPLFKLNAGKQSYNSNEQANLDYLTGTLDSYLVQIEQSGRLQWLAEAEQATTYLRYNRDSFLRMDATTRATVIEKRIQSGQLTPNEARQIEDLSPFDGGDAHYFPGNMAVIGPNGDLIVGAPAQAMAMMATAIALKANGNGNGATEGYHKEHAHG